MTDTVIKENHAPRKLAGGVLAIIGLPIALLMTMLVAPNIQGLADVLVLLVGPALVAVGLWALFPRHGPKARMVINDETITIVRPKSVIPLGTLLRVRNHVPIYSKHQRLTLTTEKGDTVFDVANLTHEAADIISFISIRLERQGAYLKEGRTEIAGAKNGIWEVHRGAAFETAPNSANVRYGTE